MSSPLVRRMTAERKPLMNLAERVPVLLSKHGDLLAANPRNDDPIYLVLQYFVHSNSERHREMQHCLKRNVRLGQFKEIILLGEREYSPEELGLTAREMEAVRQVVIGHRMKYSSVFLRVKLLRLKGYVVFANSDIFFDESIANLRRSALSVSKSAYTLLRYEYTGKERNLRFCRIFTRPGQTEGRADSQDAWAYHTDQLEVTSDLIKQSDFMLGMPGCDNKIAYVLHANGYRCYNACRNVKIYHFHATQIRNYSAKDLIPPPYMHVVPT
jgi:hypothetical protein